MPSNFKYRSGLSSAGAYQVSGVPFMSGSGMVIPVKTGTPVKVSFPYVTQWVIVENTSNQAIRVGFSHHGMKYHALSDTDPINYFVLKAQADDESMSRVRLDVRVKDIYLLSDTSTVASAQIAAGLTTVPTEELTGTYDNWSGSSGVG